MAQIVTSVPPDIVSGSGRAITPRPVAPTERDARDDLRLILQKQIVIQWLEASFHCMERENRGSDR